MDKLIRGSLKNHAVRFFVVNITNTVAEMKKLHGTTPTATAAAGRIITGTVLMSSMLKNKKDKISLIVEGDGKLGRVIATSGLEPTVKCDILNPGIDLMINEYGKLDVAKAVGTGFLTVTYDAGNNKPYSGKVELITSEIGEDLTYYFAKSEQIPSIVSLGVLVDKGGKVINAGGYIVQLMPGCDESMITYLEDKVSKMEPLTELFQKGLSTTDIVKAIFGEHEFNINKEDDVSYYCDCSQEKVEKTLIAIGKHELENILKEQDDIEMKCHFCNTKYMFNKQQVISIINQA